MHSETPANVNVDELREHVIHLHEKQEYKSPKHQNYETKPNRYSFFGWNRNSQQCYSKVDLDFLATIKHEFETEFGVEKSEKYFKTLTQSKWQGLWTCTTPEFLEKETLDSLTLVNRPVKDANAFPLWKFADNMARQIANWQSDRIKGQNIELHNDPSMLSFKILRILFYDELALLEAKEESISYLMKLQNFVKNLVYKAPDYGPDRSHLHEIQNKIAAATNIIENAITNKELPRLLTDVLTNSQSLENTIGMHLHYLVDQRVTDNFSSEYFQSKTCKLNDSPVCILFQAEGTQQNEFTNFNRFYDYKTVVDPQGKTQVSAQLKMDLLKNIHFNNHIDKRKYLELAAVLDSLITVRKTIEDLQTIQEDVGNYNFALKFTEATKKLSTNYVSLVNKAQGLIENLMKSADKGKSAILNNKLQTAFAHNLRLLETRATKDAKVTQYLRDAAESMRKYQNALENLVADIQTGEASREVENALNRLSQRIEVFNQLFPALVDNVEVNMDDLSQTNAMCPINGNEVTEAHNKFAGFWEDKEIDPINKKEIFTYKLYEDLTKKKLLGSITFYGMPALCVDEEHKQNNIYKTSGIFNDLKDNIDNYSIQKICEVVPPSTFDRVLYCTKNGIFAGAFTGGSNMVAYTFKSFGSSDTTAALAKHITYYGCILVLNFYNLYQESVLLGNTSNVLNSLLAAVWETGQSMLIGTVIYIVKELISPYIKNQFSSEKKGMNNQWFNALLPYFVRIPNFLLQSYKNGFFEASITTGATIFTEKTIEYTGRQLLT